MKFAAAIVPVVALACVDHDLHRFELRQEREQRKEIPLNLRRGIDLLFVIDDSSSMAGEQASLRANFPGFVAALEGVEGGLPDLHIAVVSTDLGIGEHAAPGCSGDGDGGRFQVGDGCPTTDGRPFITTDPANHADGLAAQFACMADLGTAGCGFEQPLAAMKAALDDNPANRGFLRDHAYLAVVFVTDEDDCSAREGSGGALFDPSVDDAASELGFFASFRCWEHGVVCDGDDPAPRDMPADGTPSPRTGCAPREDSPYVEPVQHHVGFLKGLKADPNRVLVAGILGDPEPVAVQRRDLDDDAELEHALVPSCGGLGQEIGAAPATRLAAFLDAFSNRNVFQTICAANLAGALAQIASGFGRLPGVPCLEGELTDADPAVDGLQPDCRVAAVQRLGTDDAVETSIPTCELTGGATPCYRLPHDPASCSGEQFPSGLSFEVDYGTARPPEVTTHVVRCRAE